MIKIASGSTTALPLALVLATALLFVIRLGVAIYEAVHPPRATAEIVWQPSDSLTFSKSYEEKPILLAFCADWCISCRFMDETGFCNKDVVSVVERSFRPVKVVDRKREEGQNKKNVQALEDKFEVSHFPTLIIALSDGTLVDTKKGVAKPSELLHFLKDGEVLQQYSIGKEMMLNGRYQESADLFRKFLSDKGWKHWRSNYAGIMASQCLYLLGKKDEADDLMKEAANKLHDKEWPYPVVQYYAGEIGFEELERKAGDKLQFRINMHSSVGLRDFADKEYGKAKEHFDWVLEKSPKKWFEYRDAQKYSNEIDELTK